MTGRSRPVTAAGRASLWCLAASLLSVAAFARPASAGPDDALVDQVLAVYGGKAALAKVKAYRMEGRSPRSCREPGRWCAPSPGRTG